MFYLAKYLINLFSLGSADGEQHMLGLLPSHIHTPIHTHSSLDSQGREGGLMLLGLNIQMYR